MFTPEVSSRPSAPSQSRRSRARGAQIGLGALTGLALAVTTLATAAPLASAKPTAIPKCASTAPAPFSLKIPAEHAQFAGTVHWTCRSVEIAGSSRRRRSRTRAAQTHRGDAASRLWRDLGAGSRLGPEWHRARPHGHECPLCLRRVRTDRAVRQRLAAAGEPAGRRRHHQTRARRRQRGRGDRHLASARLLITKQVGVLSSGQHTHRRSGPVAQVRPGAPRPAAIDTGVIVPHESPCRPGRRVRDLSVCR